MIKNVIRSPLFYVGDKYKLMSQLRMLFPKNINNYIEPFVGGGSSFLNTMANHYLLNDIDKNIINLHKFLFSCSNSPNKLFDNLFDIIESYGLSCSYRKVFVPNDLKKRYVKTYYSHYNRDAYNKLKKDYNENHEICLLYLLLIYGFNHMIRFNSNGIFNLPVGNVDFNKNVFDAISLYLEYVKEKDINFFNKDYMDFLEKIKIDKKDFVYFDPPYLISSSEYNKFWNVKEENRLLDYMDSLNKKEISFGITNLISHKGQRNEIFEKWAKKYNIYNIDSNYISFNDNTIKTDSKEVYVTNVKRKI